MPERIQLSRKKGWRLPENARSVARPTKYGNPFRVGAPHPVLGWPMSAQESVGLFEAQGVPEWIEELRGFDLACWCDPAEHWCHARPLLEWANR